jgi:opacity protein-like surface antigen
VHIKGYSQELTIGPGVGFMKFQDKPVSYVNELKGTDYFNYNKEFYFGLKSKFHIPYTPVKISAQSYYAFLTDNFTNPAKDTSYKASGSLVTVGLGLELMIIPGCISPYIFFDGFLSSFGDVNVKRLDHPDVKQKEVTGNARFGIGFGPGVEFAVMNRLDGDVNIRYSINNWIGKEKGEANINSFNFSFNLLYQIF